MRSLHRASRWWWLTPGYDEGYRRRAEQDSRYSRECSGKRGCWNESLQSCSESWFDLPTSFALYGFHFKCKGRTSESNLFMHTAGYYKQHPIWELHAEIHQGGYLAGMVAGKMTKSPIRLRVGSSSGGRYPYNINAHNLSTESSNKVNVVWVISNYYREKNKPHTKCADVLMAAQAFNTGNPSPQQKAQSFGGGNDSDMTRYAPDAYFCTNWLDLYCQWRLLKT